jgi:tetratricopeptide (TPR) repeat protein
VDPAGVSTSERAIAAARRLQPGLPELALAAAQHLWVTGATAEAINRELTVAERLRPNDPDVFSFRAVLAVRSGDSAKAVEFLRRSIALDPRNGGYVNRLGNALTNLGRYEEAEVVYRQAYELLGSSVPITNLAWLYLFWKWDADLARRTLDEAPAAVRSDRYWGVRASALTEIGDFAGALAAVNQVTHRTDNARIPVLNRAQIHEAMGDAAAARRDYLEALQIAEQQVRDFANSNRGPANLAVAYAGLGRKDEAIARARIAARMSGNDDWSLPGSPWDPLAILPRILARFGQMDEAIALTETHIASGRFRRNILLYSTSWAQLRKDPRFPAIAEKAQR